ncbi:MAG: flagellar basal body P-ring formation chaperone FlgA [Alphaproteobacteria bacterium]|jgi:flagella basal body P-ring formation protein FlgA|nr:flagellar basal body P-ring formation chaperone FlgA [Alphaproteobacteria bacterium]
MKKVGLIILLGMSWKTAYAYRTLQDLDTANNPLFQERGINANELAPLVQEAARDAVDQNVEITLDEQTVPLSKDALETASVFDFAVEKDGLHFTALIQAPSLKEPFTISGTYYPAKEIPVLRRLPAPGDAITEQDLVWKKVPLRKLSRTTLTKTEDILGCVVRSHTLKVGVPLRHMDVEKPLLVKRNEAVLITVQDAKISLTLEGTALEQGEKGQRIRVLNPMSKRTLYGVVVDHKRVEIERPMRLAQTFEGNRS